MKALIIDPALHSIGGHHFSAHQRVARSLHSLRVECRSLGSRLICDQEVEALGIEPCFSNSIYTRADWTREEFTQHVATTQQQLARALRWKWPKPDLLVLPCCDQVLALAVARFFRGYSQERRPHVVMWLLFPPSVQGLVDEGSICASGEYKEAFAELRAVIGGTKIAVYCETESMAEAYSGLIGLNVSVAPGPNLAEGSRPSKRSRISNVKTICCTGHANAPKGYRLLPQAIAEVLKWRRDVHFKIHGTINILDLEKDFETFQALAKMGPQVIVRDRVMSKEEYLEWLEDSDLLLLPYDPLVYKFRGSGVFSEACILGLPAIVTAGCSFAESAFKAGRAYAIEQHDSTAIASAILGALECLPDLSARATAFANSDACHITSQLILESSLQSIWAQRSNVRNRWNQESMVK